MNNPSSMKIRPVEIDKIVLCTIAKILNHSLECAEAKNRPVSPDLIPITKKVRKEIWEEYDITEEKIKKDLEREDSESNDLIMRKVKESL